MELNGIANIKIMIDRAVSENTESHTAISVELADKINSQLEILNRYMVAYADHKRSVISFQKWPNESEIDYMVKEPLWHEVRESPTNYPTLSEKIEGDK